MKHYFRTITALALTLMSSALVPSLKADEWDKRTNITIAQSIEIQGTVLPPGSYVINVIASSSDQRTVQIFAADKTHIVATVLAFSAYRRELGGGSEFKFYAAAEGQPPALKTWFYPGDDYGLQFRPGRGEAATESARRHKAATTSGSD